jgi:16S rRNA (cytosine967-C5)-methyltransferase
VRKPSTKPPAAGLAVRRAAATRLRQVLSGAAFQPFAAGEIGDARDRALANRLVTTALRRHGQLDAVLAELLKKGLPKRAGDFEAILRLALAQLLFLSDLGAHSALFLAVEAIKADPSIRHLAGLANAVLRRAQAEVERLSNLPATLLLPQARAAAWRTAYGEAAVASFTEALLAGAPLDLTLKTKSPALVAALGGEPVAFNSVRLLARDKPVEALPGYDSGEWWVQDAAAALPARLMGLPAGARIGDFCAAPGGKTAQLVNAGYRVTALDADPVRITRLAANLERLRLAAEIVTGDAASFVPQEKFDGLLLDAPCTATGTFRRHPEVLWHIGQADIESRVALQRRLIAHAATCLKEGGVLVYCVCSLEAAEGEAQAEWVAGHVESLTPLPVTAAELDAFAPALTDEGQVRTHPGLAIAPGGVDGFFVMRFRKNCGE